ncbi:MAG TPA: phosphotransferase [Thermoanaerobaculia bacterium]|jgi:hypothetical protein|nr:phosphotransferase [Thermoanaerobaculia bacterium]
MPALAEVEAGTRLLAQVRAGQPGQPGDGLEPLSQPFPGHPGVWLWTGEDLGPLVVKHAEPGDREGREMLRREAGALTALAPTGVVPELRLTFVEEGELAGFAMPFIASSPALALGSPLAISAFAAALAAFHAHSWRLPHPPFGLEVALALGGHTLWIGGAEILTGMCDALRGGPCHEVARLAREALELLATLRPAMAERFAPEDMVLAHGDVAGGNLVFHRDGPTLCCLLIDLGEVVVAPSQYDLARYAVGARLSAEGEDLLLSVYGGHWRRLTRSPLTAEFRTGFETLKPFAVFDTQVAPYVIYPASGIPVDPSQAEDRTVRGLAAIRSALAAG